MYISTKRPTLPKVILFEFNLLLVKKSADGEFYVEKLF